MKNIAINVVILLCSVVGYFMLQIVGAFIEFFVYGSGEGIENNELLFPTIMVIVQLLILIAVKRRTSVFRGNIIYGLSLSVPLGLFILVYIK
ncbi:hypothetical protein EYV94_14500 [Puteibacter caeruleilacunae]|nr:hypothetical protein EYV94_14500 [Puteibacter caeruleilacunae]